MLFRLQATVVAAGTPGVVVGVGVIVGVGVGVGVGVTVTVGVGVGVESGGRFDSDESSPPLILSNAGPQF